MRVMSAMVAVGLLLAFVVLVVFFRFGRSGGEAVAATMQEGSIEVQGIPRTFLICLPNSFRPGRRYPIVVMLHGGALGSGHLLAMQTGACDFVDGDRFIAVFPNADGHDQWNDGRSTTAGLGDDMLFLQMLVAHVAAQYGGDPNRAFVAGISNGGMMALRMACESTGTFRAYVAVSANLPEEERSRCRPSRPVPILFIMGNEDPETPWAGGSMGMGVPFEAAGRQVAASGRVLSTRDSVRFFADVDGCNGEEVTDLPNRVDDGTSVRRYSYRCAHGPVELYEIVGGGHGWPGSRLRRPPQIDRLFGVVSQQIDATAVMIDFFKKNGL